MTVAAIIVLSAFIIFLAIMATKILKAARAYRKIEERYRFSDKLLIEKNKREMP